MSKEKEKKTVPSSWQIIKTTISFLCKVAYKEDKRFFLLYFLKFIADAMRELKTLLLPKLLIDELTLITRGESYELHLKNIVIYVVITLAAEFLSSFLGNIADSCKSVYAERLDERLSELLCDKCMSMDFQYTEDPAVLDKVDRAKEGISWYSGGIVGIANCLYSALYGLVVALTTITIIAVYCPLLLPVQLVAMFFVMLFRYRNTIVNAKAFMELAKSNRVFSYVYWELADFRYGKDVRLYDSSSLMGTRAKKYADIQINIWKKQAKGRLKNDYGSNIANALRDGVSYFYMGVRAIKGIITIGDFTLCVASASRLYQSLLQLGENLQSIYEKCRYAYKFIEFMDYPDALSKGTKEVLDGEHTIVFENVSFKYPRSDRYVLENINLTIRPGEHLAIVGLNGAGKTTFIKLLCRLYDVTEGRILIDGTDIREYSEDEYRKLFAVVFQDFKLFAFSLKENIEFSDAFLLDKEESERRAKEVLELSGLYEDASKLDKGIDTMIFKSFDEHGTELSGGQQQKTAISRALYKDAPIVILDEPTAALDPIAEYDIYKKFDTLVGGKSAIYISHRLSSCKFCDRIAVFADSTIKEYGTHEELVKMKGGVYATMFNTQAKYYVKNAAAK